jgi:hypothetical protein
VISKAVGDAGINVEMMPFQMLGASPARDVYETERSVVEWI